MPYDDPDPQDPMMLVGVGLPADRATQVEMAYTFAEEFARLGYSEGQVMNLFREPFYSGANDLFRDLGEREVAKIVHETLSVWGQMYVVDRDVVREAIATMSEEGDDE